VTSAAQFGNPYAEPLVQYLPRQHEARLTRRVSRFTAAHRRRVRHRAPAEAWRPTCPD